MLRLKQEDLAKYTDADGNITFPESVIFEGDLVCKGYLYCEDYLYCKGEYFIVAGTLFWSHISMPKIPEKHYIKSFMPQAWQKEHCVERLGFSLDGCYEEIRKTVGRKIFNLLADNKWLPVERKMLESIRDYEKPAPEWVADIIKAKIEAEKIKE